MLFQVNMCELLHVLYGKVKVNFSNQILDIKISGFNKFGIFKYFNFGFLCVFPIHCFFIIIIV